VYWKEAVIVFYTSIVNGIYFIELVFSNNLWCDGHAKIGDMQSKLKTNVKTFECGVKRTRNKNK
jgi:prepilin-type processing-associated H-X9-DG protein